MTTFNFTGITVTTTDGVATSVASSTLALSGSEALTLKFLPTAATSTDFSLAEVTVSVYQRLFSIAADGTRVDPTTALSIAEYEWTEDGVEKTALVLRVDTGVANTYSYYVLDGDDFPTFADAAAYTTFLATVTISSDSIPNQYLYVSQTDDNDLPTVADSIVQADSIVGGLTDDWSTSTTALKTGLGNDTVIGLDIRDIIYAGVGADLIEGGLGNDSLYLEGGDDTGYAGAGNDVMNGGSGNDWLSGSDGDDTLNAGTGNDTVYSGTGNDSVIGDLGADWMSGSDGDDSMYGGDGLDTLWGGTGNDLMRVGTGDDFANGGTGNDSLYGDTGHDTLYGDHGADRIEGGFGNDLLVGEEDNDTVLGGSGNDTVQGNAGADSLNGGDGVDFVNGGTGADTVSGGAGSDFFVFVTGDGTDTFVDFRDNIDTLRLTSTAADTWLELKALATQSGTDVVFDLGTDTITIKNITITQLSDDVAFI